MLPTASEPRRYEMNVHLLSFSKLMSRQISCCDQQRMTPCFSSRIRWWHFFVSYEPTLWSWVSFSPFQCQLKDLWNKMFMISLLEKHCVYMHKPCGYTWFTVLTHHFKISCGLSFTGQGIYIHWPLHCAEEPLLLALSVLSGQLVIPLQDRCSAPH